MNIELLVVGKTDSKEVEALVELYARRVNRYCRFAVTALPDVRNTRSPTQNQQRTAEGEAILRQLAAGDHVVLLDERGDEMRSVEFAYWLQKRMLGGVRRLVLVIGGPYGFSDAVYARADGESGMVPAKKVDVFDTTGAGDAFFAGTVIGLTYGKTLAEACEIGSRLAASVICISENVCPRFRPQEFGLDVPVTD